MSLRDEITRENHPRVYTCVVCDARAALSPNDQKDLDECIADREFTASAIARVLAERGFNVHPDGKQVRRHRKVCAS